jgi:hypothetical protein
MSRYSSSEKMVVKNNRKVFYNEGSYVINNILVKKGDEISFSDLKKIFRGNRLLRELYYNISNVGSGRCMYYDFFDFSDRYKINVYGMINNRLGMDLNIVKKGSRLFLVKEDFSVLKKDYKMIKDNINVFCWEEK